MTAPEEHVLPNAPIVTCAACGAPVPADARFCGSCGASLGARRCGHCGAELSPRARFCHRCGQPAVPGAVRGNAPSPAQPRSERGAWLVAAAIVALLVGAIVWRVERGTAPAAVPDMANPGAGGAAPFASGGPSGAAPDISSMSPRERFDRLFNRVMQAADRGDSTTVTTFTPMALGAYSQLDTIDVDARYHAALLLLQVGGVPAALALADSIESAQPGHLFGYLIRGSAADLAQNDTMRRQAYRDFLRHYAGETRANRPEYQEHEQAIDEFKKKAEAENKSVKSEK